MRCGDFMGLDPETKGEVAIQIFAASVRVSALASIGGFGPVELIEKGCRDNGLQTAMSAAEAALDN